MRNRMKMISVVLGVVMFAALVVTGVQAEEDVPADFKKDKTGTNPVNFTFDARIYNEFQWLNTAGDGEQNVTTFEFRAPFADGKWQFRGKARGTYLKADLNDDGNAITAKFGWPFCNRLVLKRLQRVA
jgi:hypothetical protein